MANTVKSSGLGTFLMDPLEPTSAEPAYAPRVSKGMWGLPLLIGIALLVVTFVFWAIDPKQFYASYLVGWTFCVSLALGALFFVIIQHLVKARWSVVVRRIPEALTVVFPLLAILSIPVLIGMHDLYHWTHAELFDPNDPAYDKVIAGKQAYLNTPFFIARLALYFVLWSYLSYRLYKLSVQQDVDPDPSIPAKQRATSAWGLAVCAVTAAFASYDLLMSTDPHWFSTIFGVYFFGGSFAIAHAFIALVAIMLQRGGMVQHEIGKSQYHDLGKMMFGFTVFWAYIAFSQYMLIWYANLPEETIWYRHRLEHGWEYHSAALLVFHFILPFILLLPNWVKKKPALLSIMAVWFFVMQWFDFHWVVMPAVFLNEPDAHATISLVSVTAWLGLFLITYGTVMYRLGRHSLLPQNDPYLAKSLRLAHH